MRLDLAGHPIHTRALSVVLTAGAGGELAASADLVDLRKRGFTPVGSEVQGAGIIHQMGVDVRVEPSGTIADVAVRQPVVAFEASSGTLGESCRDVAGRLRSLCGSRVDDPLPLRTAMGGAAGCSHLLAVGQFLCATLAGAAPAGAPNDVPHRRLRRRDLIFDGSELAGGRLAIVLQLSDLHTAPAAAGERPMARFARHDELRLLLELDGWPATIARVGGGERCRVAADFAGAPWRALDGRLAGLAGLSLGKGATRALLGVAGDHAPLRDALLQLVPALIQCRASFPDKWLDRAATTPDHDGLIGMADSCYMWRRGGALERLRAQR